MPSLTESWIARLIKISRFSRIVRFSRITRITKITRINRLTRIARPTRIAIFTRITIFTRILWFTRINSFAIITKITKFTWITGITMLRKKECDEYIWIFKWIIQPFVCIDYFDIDVFGQSFMSILFVGIHSDICLWVWKLFEYSNVFKYWYNFSYKYLIRHSFGSNFSYKYIQIFIHVTFYTGWFFYWPPT